MSRLAIGRDLLAREAGWYSPGLADWLYQERQLLLESAMMIEQLSQRPCRDFPAPSSCKTNDGTGLWCDSCLATTIMDKEGLGT